MKLRPAEDESIHANGGTDGQTDRQMETRIVASRNIAPTPKIAMFKVKSLMWNSISYTEQFSRCVQNPSWAIINKLDDKQITADVIGKKGSTHKNNNKRIKT